MTHSHCSNYKHVQTTPDVHRSPNSIFASYIFTDIILSKEKRKKEKRKKRVSVPTYTTYRVFTSIRPRLVPSHTVIHRIAEMS